MVDMAITDIRVGGVLGQGLVFSPVGIMHYFSTWENSPMRTICALVAAALLFAAVPAQAADGRVPSATLKALGLGDLTVMSDRDAQQIRGQSSGVMAMSQSLVTGLLIDPNTKSFIFGTDTNGAMSSAENAGLQVLSQASTSSTSSVSLNLTVTSANGTFTGALIGGAGGGAAAAGQ